jgi:hypothetical protein
MLSHDNATTASRLDAFLAAKTPSQRRAYRALTYRDPRTLDEWRLWGEAQAEFARWRRLGPAAPDEGLSDASCPTDDA